MRHNVLVGQTHVSFRLNEFVPRHRIIEAAVLFLRSLSHERIRFGQGGESGFLGLHQIEILGQVAARERRRHSLFGFVEEVEIVAVARGIGSEVHRGTGMAGCARLATGSLA